MTGSAALNATARERQLIDLTERLTASLGFEAILRRHSRAIEAARIISEGLVKTIAAEVATQRGNPSAYGASGRANTGDSRAVAFNRTA